MGFMEAQLTDKEWWYEVDGPNGREFIPESVTGRVDLSAGFDSGSEVPASLRDYCENRTAYSIGRVFGYGVRSSAPGYMDCTPWSVYTSKRDATKAYNEERRENA